MESHNLESQTMPETQTILESENNNVAPKIESPMLGAILLGEATPKNNINIAQNGNENPRLSKTTSQVQNTQTADTMRETKQEVIHTQQESQNCQGIDLRQHHQSAHGSIFFSSAETQVIH